MANRCYGANVCSRCVLSGGIENKRKPGLVRAGEEIPGAISEQGNNTENNRNIGNEGASGHSTMINEKKKNLRNHN